MEEDKRFFDVSKPQPHPTSRPVIVGHHPMMPDPMLREDRPPSSHNRVNVAVKDDASADSPSLPSLGDTSAGYEKTPALAPSASVGAEALPPVSEKTPEPSASIFASTGLDQPQTSDYTEAAVTSRSDNGGSELHVPAGEMRHNHQPRLWAWIVIALIVLASIYAAIDAKTDLLPFHIFSHDQNTQSSSETGSANSTSSSSQPVSLNQSNLPAGFTQYQPTGTPVVFAYPRDWGTPTTTTDVGFSQRGTNKKSDGTYAYLVHFATNKDIEIAITSSKYLSPARGTLYYDYLQWCLGTNDSKFYKQTLHFTTSNGVDSPTTITCDQGPLTDATKISNAVIVQAKTKDAQGSLLGDVYTANLSGGGSLAVLRVKDAKMTNGDNIKKLISTITGAADNTSQ